MCFIKKHYGIVTMESGKEQESGRRRFSVAERFSEWDGDDKKE